MIAEFRGLLREWITIAPYRTEDSYTEPTWGDPVRVQVKIIGQSRVLFDGQGRQIVSRQKIILGSRIEVTLRDKIVLTGRDPVTPTILGVEKIFDERGWHHTEVFTS